MFVLKELLGYYYTRILVFVKFFGGPFMHFNEANEFHIHRDSFEECAYNNFRYNFKTIRQAHHLTLADMADILCLRSRSTLSELENGNHRKMLAIDLSLIHI